MRRSLPAFSAQSAQIAKSISKSDRSSIASINVSSMISMPSFAPSASKSHDKGAKLEQNPPYSHYNGLIHSTTGPGFMSAAILVLGKHPVEAAVMDLCA